MRNTWILVLVSAVLMGLSVNAAAADVEIRYHKKYCVVGEDCTLDVYVNSFVPLGRLSVLLRFNSAYMTVTNVQSGNYLPTQVTLRWTNDVNTFSPTLCPAPTYCGQIQYNAYDAADSTSGPGLLFRVTFTVNTTTQLFWSPCTCWCNQYICVSPTPFATSYDGSTYTMGFYPDDIVASSQPLTDTDGDCMPDVVEAMAGTDPNDMDSDDDGLMDGNCGSEDLNNDGFVQPGETDPNDADTDDDGIFDGTEAGLTAPETPDTDLAAGNFIPDADPLTTTDPTNPDSDGDGVPDGVEDPNRNGAYEPELGESDPKNSQSTPPVLPTLTGVKVLILGDGDAEDQVQTALEAAGHQVTVVDYYYDWDGVTPDVNDFQFVVLLDGYDYGYELEDTAGTALEAFVARNCPLLITEWTAYDIEDDDKTGPIADLIPVISPDGDYDDGLTWSVVATHPLTAGLPTSWYDDADSTDVEAKPGAVVLIRSEDQVPLLTYSTRAGGTVVHLNHSMTYSTDTIDSNALQIIINAVENATGCPIFVNGFETGDCSMWSLEVGGP